MPGPSILAPRPCPAHGSSSLPDCTCVVLIDKCRVRDNSVSPSTPRHLGPSTLPRNLPVHSLPLPPYPNLVFAHCLNIQARFLPLQMTILSSILQMNADAKRPASWPFDKNLYVHALHAFVACRPPPTLPLPFRRRPLHLSFDAALPALSKRASLQKHSSSYMIYLGVLSTLSNASSSTPQASNRFATIKALRTVHIYVPSPDMPISRSTSFLGVLRV
ncbi:hypothetical protein C8R46DRAFT_1358079 [Mycena filopes]|nr:hypothetical protein C8R46DRAFT_1358079 [Mycena filopes]